MPAQFQILLRWEVSLDQYPEKWEREGDIPLSTESEYVSWNLGKFL